MKLQLREKGGEVDKLYLPIHEAAEYVGVGERYLRDLLNSTNPPPYLRVGNKKLLQKSALADYFESIQEVKL